MILKYLKLRTIRILRDKYLHSFTCNSVGEIRLGMVNWYHAQVKDFAIDNNLYRHVPFTVMALINNTEVFEERKIFLDWLEQEVIAGRK